MAEPFAEPEPEPEALAEPEPEPEELASTDNEDSSKDLDPAAYSNQGEFIRIFKIVF